MKQILISISLLISLTLNSQVGNKGLFRSLLGTVTVPRPVGPTTNLSFTDIASTTDFERPGGNEVWNFNSGLQITASVPTPSNSYFRLDWLDCESNTVAGDYSKLWSDPTQSGSVGRARRRFMTAIDNGQTVSFGIMQLYPEVCTAGGYNSFASYDGACSAYPLYVHNLMQGQANPYHNDFNDGTTWIPAYNNPSLLARWDSLQRNVRRWVDTASYTPTSGPKNGQLVYFRDILSYVDVRGVGSYGEWHHCCLGGGYDVIANWPGYVDQNNPGAFPTIATMKRIVDITADAFDDYPCTPIINILDGMRFNNTKIPVEVGIYALTKTNTYGKLGLRRDQWGDNASYYSQILQDNTMSFGGVRADTAVVNRYKYAPFVGEPPGYNNFGSTLRNGVFMGWLPFQVETLHAYSVGNGNYGGNAPTGSGADSIRKAFRLAGSRIKINGGLMTTTLTEGESFNVTVQVQNIGLATEHMNWTVTYELRNVSNNVVWTGTPPSAYIKGLIPSATATTFSDDFVVPAIPDGAYRLVIKIIDPANYRSPYPLGITGREGDGAYQLRSGIIKI